MAHQKIYEELRALFDYNPPSTHLSEDSIVTFSYPNMFYDRHLDSRLGLRHVKLVPSVHREIAELVFDELRVLKNKGQLLPLTINGEDGCCFSKKAIRQDYPPLTTIEDADSVVRFYEEASFYNCASIASTIDLHPHAPTWLPILSFDPGYEYSRNPDPAMVDTSVLRILHHSKTGKLVIPQSIWSCLDNELRHDIRTISDKFKRLATFQFHAPLKEVEETFKIMNLAAKKNKLLSLKCSDVDYTVENVTPLSLGPDSATTMQLLPSVATAHAATHAMRCSARLIHQKKRHTDAVSASNEKSLPTLMIRRSNITKLDSTAFIQRAWTRAVEYDTTLIIFNCGNYERIGFRHRGSQTLFLSDLIDISGGSNPAYGKLQIGVYMIIMRDTLDRIRQIKASANTEIIVSKRKRTGESERTDLTSKRQRTRSAVISESMAKEKVPVADASSIILQEISRRTLALLRMQYGIFNSPEPAVLYRTGCAVIPHDVLTSDLPVTDTKKRKYTPNEYFLITLTSEIAEGATGKVHGAKIEVQMSDGCTHICKGAVKVAFGDRKRQKLRHEYAVYRYMASKGVKGVATVYGLFEDTLNEAMILVMEHAGTSLVSQPHYREHGEVNLTNEEREAFKTAMTEIHEAGVRHYDIRPENLMMDDQGRTTIIDFDAAKVGAGKRSRKREFTHLCSLLDGEYDLPNQRESPRTSASAVSPPGDDDILEGRIHSHFNLYN